MHWGVCSGLGEGITVGTGWAGVMYKQRLWSVPENMYRIVSCKVAEHIVDNELLVHSLQWLMMPQEDLEKMVEGYKKVFAEYIR